MLIDRMRDRGDGEGATDEAVECVSPLDTSDDPLIQMLRRALHQTRETEIEEPERTRQGGAGSGIYDTPRSYPSGVDTETVRLLREMFGRVPRDPTPDYGSSRVEAVEALRREMRRDDGRVGSIPARVCLSLAVGILVTVGYVFLSDEVLPLAILALAPIFLGR